MCQFAECDRAPLLRETAARIIGGWGSARYEAGLETFPSTKRHSLDLTLKDTISLSLQSKMLEKIICLS